MADGQRKSLVEQHLANRDTHAAGDEVNAWLVDDPDDAEALLLLARVLIDTDKPAVALPVARQACKRMPQRWEPWYLLGAAEVFLQRPLEARKALFKAITLKRNAAGLRLLANALVLAYDFDGTEQYAQQSLDMEESWEARILLAFSQLHKRQWREGWRNYRCQLGMVDDRAAHDYGLPEWAGQDGKVLVYGEQGLGDQLAFCSAVNPHQLVCHPKIANLMSRSFREVHGDQFAETCEWPITAEYQTSMASAMQYVEMQPRGRYLAPHPGKRLQWQALIDSLGNKPKIGLAWTGGRPQSYGWRSRNLALEDLLPILQMPYTFISLEYKDRSDEIAAFTAQHGIEIHDYPWGTITDDYDDTAALVDCLDAVVCVPTTAYHLAGGLGVPAHVIVHDAPHWHEGVEGPCPWWQSVQFYRRPELGTAGAVNAVVDALSVAKAA